MLRDLFTGLSWALWLLMLLGVYILLVLCLPTSCAAQELERPDLPELTLEPCPDAASLRAGVEVEGTSGVWFPRLTAECMLGRLTQLQEAVPYIRLLEERLRLDDDRHALQQRQVDLAEAQAQAATNALEAALRRAREAEEALDAWYRHPALWFAIGVVATVVLEVVAIWAISEVAP